MVGCRDSSVEEQCPADACLHKMEANMSLITLTRPIGCNAIEIARRVADGLNVNVYDDTRLKLEGLRMGLTTDHYHFHKDWDDPTL
jgi:hypothetical protein